MARTGVNFVSGLGRVVYVSSCWPEHRENPQSRQSHYRPLRALLRALPNDVSASSAANASMVATAQGSPASVVAYVAKNTLVLDYHALSSLVAKHRYDRSAVRCTTTTTKHISRAGGTLSPTLGTDGALDATHRRTHTSRAPNTSESPFHLQVRRAAGGAIYSITKSQGQP